LKGRVNVKRDREVLEINKRETGVWKDQECTQPRERKSEKKINRGRVTLEEESCSGQKEKV